MTEGDAVHGDLETILLDDLKLPADRLASPQITLDDAGVDSLTVVELSVLLGERFGIQVSETDIHAAATLGQLDDLIQRKRHEHEHEQR
jgi:acyl carrier protein